VGDRLYKIWERWRRDTCPTRVHVVFSTKERRKLIPRESRPRLWAYLAGVCKKQGIFVHEISA
jgi:REP element-mobilizing transposase RayT